MRKCGYCGGDGEIDSGGVNPDGSGINIPCPERDPLQAPRCCFGAQSKSHHCPKPSTVRHKDQPKLTWCDEHSESFAKESLETIEP